MCVCDVHTRHNRATTIKPTAGLLMHMTAISILSTKRLSRTGRLFRQPAPLAYPLRCCNLLPGAPPRPYIHESLALALVLPLRPSHCLDQQWLPAQIECAVLEATFFRAPAPVQWCHSRSSAARLQLLGFFLVFSI